MLGRAASCCDLLRLSPTPGDSSEDDDTTLTHTLVDIHVRVLWYNEKCSDLTIPYDGTTRERSQRTTQITVYYTTAHTVSATDCVHAVVVS